MAARPVCNCHPSVTRGAHRIEDVRKLEVVDAAEADEIILGSVEVTFCWLGLAVEGRKRFQIRQTDRVDDVVNCGGGKLDEALDTLAIGAGSSLRFSIDAYHLDKGQERGLAHPGYLRQRRESEVVTRPHT